MNEKKEKTSDRMNGISFKPYSIDYGYVFKGYAIMVHDGGEETVVDMPLFKIEDEMNDPRLFRIHKSYLVNLCKIRELLISDKRVSVRVNGLQLPVSRRRKAGLMKALGQVSI